MSVLLCDDHDLFRDALASALTARGHKVVDSVRDPDHLTQRVGLLRPDVCLLDVSFDGEDRLDVAVDLRRTGPPTVLLLLTAAAPAPVWQVFDDRIVDGVVSKVCHVADLDAAIRRSLAGERVVQGWPGRVTAGHPDAGFEPLTEREREILLLIVEGVSTQTMADVLGVSSNTVRTHVQNVLRKLQVHHRGKAVRRALDLGLV